VTPTSIRPRSRVTFIASSIRPSDSSKSAIFPSATARAATSPSLSYIGSSFLPADAERAFEIAFGHQKVGEFSGCHSRRSDITELIKNGKKRYRKETPIPLV
jgi:hypothetical protein